MEFTAAQISDLLKGEVVGDSNTRVSSFSKIEEGKSGSISFLANKKYTEHIYNTEASIVIVNQDFVPAKPIKSVLIKVEDAYKSVAILLDMYNKIKTKPKGIEKKSFVHKTVKMGKDVFVGSFAYLSKNVCLGDNSAVYPGVFLGENVIIGSNTILHPQVTVYNNCVIGDNCIVHAGTVIGADGFGFAPNENSEFVKIAQIGNVIVEDNVEIGALVTIDRATIGSTIIRKGVKLDNQVHVAHNVDLGENTVIAAQSGIAGSAKIGRNCMFGGQIGISPHIKIADKTKLAAQSGVSKSVSKEDTILMGSPAFNIKDFHKSYIHFKNLGNLNKKIEEFEKKVGK